MAFRSFSVRLLVFLAIFGVGLVILMSGIHVRPFGFADAFDAVRVIAGGAIMGAALIFELVLEHRAPPADEGRTVARRTRKAAENGSAATQFNLSLMYDKGDGIEQDFDTAAKWCRLAAEQGHRDAQYNLGQMYRHGQGVPRDMDEAVNWLRRASA